MKLTKSSLIACCSRTEAIYMATFVILYNQRNVLGVPLPAYRKQPELFDGITQDSAIWQSLAIQLIFELITDTVCVAFEMRRGLDPLAVWRRLPKVSLLPAFSLMTVLAYIAGTSKIINGERFVECKNSDMCFCINNGLEPDGVREAYCKLLYPNTSGVPPGENLSGRDLNGIIG